MAALVARPFVLNIANRGMPISLICLSQGILPICLSWLAVKVTALSIIIVTVPITITITIVIEGGAGGGGRGRRTWCPQAYQCRPLQALTARSYPQGSTLAGKQTPLMDTFCGLRTIMPLCLGLEVVSATLVTGLVSTTLSVHAQLCTTLGSYMILYVSI